MTKRKWTNIGAGAYESGPWLIVNHTTFLNPRAGWVVLKSADETSSFDHIRVAEGRRTLNAAKIYVEMLERD